jgi:RimJ/RimL family protein N-acetyltransferase
MSLRATTATDLDFVLEAEQHSENQAYVGQWSYQQHLAALTNPDYAHLLLESTSTEDASIESASTEDASIESASTAQAVGYVIVTGLQDPDHNVNLQRLVITVKGRGYGRQVLQLVKQLAFEQWQVHRLWLDVKDYNQRARHLYASEGFVEEGILRECLKKGDTFESLVIMSILETEYHRS